MKNNVKVSIFNNQEDINDQLENYYNDIANIFSNLKVKETNIKYLRKIEYGKYNNKIKEATVLEINGDGKIENETETKDCSFEIEILIDKNNNDIKPLKEHIKIYKQSEKGNRDDG